MFTSLLGNFAEPVFYLLAFGYGFGSMLGQVSGMPYLSFLASGIICSSAMNAASFEALYSAFTRMHMQQTWSGMLSTPLEVDDVVLGEVIWAASKALINAVAITVVAVLLGVTGGWRMWLVFPAVLLTGFCFASIAMIVTALARGYDFFTYYMTLALTPMMLLSGVFFPLNQLPDVLVGLAQFLPLVHAVELIRPLMVGAPLSMPVLHVMVLLGYGIAGLWIAIELCRRRLLG